MAQAARRGKDSQLFLDDRAGLSRIEPRLDGDDRRSGRRHLRDQRPQVVHVVGRRVAIRHCDGRHRSRGRSSRPREPDHRPDRYAGFQDPPQYLRHGPRRRRLAQPQRSPLRRRARSAEESAGPIGCGIRDRASTARSRADSSLHALDGDLRTLVRSALRAGRAARSGTGRQIGNAADDPELDCRKPGGDQRGPADGVARRLENRSRRRRRRPATRSRSSSSTPPTC